MNKGEQNRKVIFDKFSNQLHLLKKEGLIDIEFNIDRPYICPICLKQFAIEDIKENSKRNYLTLEDAPPASLGGSKIALTCKKCNSDCGSKIDFHLTERIREIDSKYFYKGSKHLGTIEFEGKNVSIELTSEGNGKLIANHKIKNNNPSLLDRFIYGIKNRDVRPILNIKLPKGRVISQRVDYALLKTNYIITFSKFGYIFLLKKECDIIREQILKPDQEIYKWSPFLDKQFNNANTGTYYITDNGIEAIFNIFSLKTEYSETKIGGFMPIPSIRTENYIKNINDKKGRDNGLMINTTNYDSNADLFNNITEIRKVYNWINKK